MAAKPDDATPEPRRKLGHNALPDWLKLGLDELREKLTHPTRDFYGNDLPYLPDRNPGRDGR